MKKRLYLMRHGQTLFNARRKIQGACDSPLTELGIHQAKIARKYFEQNNITFDHAYCSTQERAVDTLELTTDMPYERLKGLKEVNFGVFEGESEDLHPPFTGERALGEHYVLFGGESELQVQERVNHTLNELMKKPDHQTVLAVSHGGCCALFLNKWAESVWEPIGNCSILVFDYAEETFELIEKIEHVF